MNPLIRRPHWRYVLTLTFALVAPAATSDEAACQAALAEYYAGHDTPHDVVDAYAPAKPGSTTLHVKATKPPSPPSDLIMKCGHRVASSLKPPKRLTKPPKRLTSPPPLQVTPVKPLKPPAPYGVASKPARAGIPPLKLWPLSILHLCPPSPSFGQAGIRLKRFSPLFSMPPAESIAEGP